MYFLIGENDVTNANVCDTTNGVFIVYQIAYWMIRIIQFGVPFALIIWGSLDFFKAVISGDEKEMKQKRKPFLHRVIAAVIVLILPSLVNIVLRNVNNETSSDFVKCWNAVVDQNDFDISVPGIDDSGAESNSSGN